MKENMLDILMYLFEHCLDSETGVMPEESVLRGHLDDAGFQHQEIDKAFAWLEALANAREHNFDDQLGSNRSIRVYATQEQLRLDRECRGFMQFLEHTGVLDPVNRELVIDRDRVYELNGEDSRTLAALGAFRVVPERDLGSDRDDLHRRLRGFSFMQAEEFQSFVDPGRSGRTCRMERRALSGA